MKTTRNILVAFLLNLAFSVFEFVGGIYTGSVAILSDAVHDMGDAASIGIAYFLEKKSKQKPDETYTYGYARYSVMGSMLTTLILLIGSIAVVANAVSRIFEPVEIQYNGMIVFAVVGICVNICAAWFTREGDSLNQKAVNLHMLEDVLGWIVVLIGAIVMRFTDFALLDPLMSICVAVFIFVSAIQNLKKALDLFLEKIPHGVSVSEIREHIMAIDGVLDVHHIHIWSVDGQNHSTTMHIVTNAAPHQIKVAIREELAEHGIGHATLELETPNEPCTGASCHITTQPHTQHHHHHHH